MANRCCRRNTIANSYGCCARQRWWISHMVLAAIMVFFFLMMTTTMTTKNFVEARSYALPNICLQPPPRSEGLCTIEIEGYYFDQRINDCQIYSSGGCRSSPGQSFGSKQDCVATCMRGTRRIQDLYENE